MQDKERFVKYMFDKLYVCLVESQKKFRIKWKINYRVRTNEIILELKMPKSSCLKWMYGCPSIVYRVDSLFTRYLTAIGIISESLKSMGQSNMPINDGT